MRKAIKRVFQVLSTIVFLAVVVFCIAGLIPERRLATHAGYKQSSSTYVEMEDGTKIAVRVDLPYDLEANEKVPVIMETTRYGTRNQYAFVANALVNMGIGKERESIFFEKLLNNHYALVRADARGSGASFGSREMEWSKEEIEDMDQIMNWITEQPWSNGKIGAYGVSYSGNTAELEMVSNNEALMAAALLYPDFNPIKHNAFPGGILNEVLMEKWSESNKAMDVNETDIFNGGTMPVDEDTNGEMLKKALAERDNIDINEAIKDITYFDEPIADGYTLESLCPYIYKKAIEKSDVPIYVRVGWHDAATVNGAIERYLTYSNPQTLVIGPWSHGGDYFFDPFESMQLSDERRFEQRVKLETAEAEELIAFFDRHLKSESDQVYESEIRYYTLNDGAWNSSKSWPIDGFDRVPIFFDTDNRLSFKKPNDNKGQDSYVVDCSATTGNGNRWHTNIGGDMITYPDRVEEDEKLLTYTSEPLENDVEITGVPIVNINIASSSGDSAVYVYLEDVAPDGTVTYLTEGQLRLIHCQETNDELGYISIGAKRSFRAADGIQLAADENIETRIEMQAISVRLEAGHCIRVAIAGHDAANFKKISDDDTVLNIQRNSISSSYIEIPMK